MESVVSFPGFCPPWNGARGPATWLVCKPAVQARYTWDVPECLSAYGTFRAGLRLPAVAAGGGEHSGQGRHVVVKCFQDDTGNCKGANCNTCRPGEGDPYEGVPARACSQVLLEGVVNETTHSCRATARHGRQQLGVGHL